jgi:hypothetical protein
MIAKLKEQQIENAGTFELFTTVEMTDVEGNKVSVLQSIGTYSVAQLEQEKAMYQLQIASVDEKLDAINNLE